MITTQSVSTSDVFWSHIWLVDVQTYTLLDIFLPVLFLSVSPFPSHSALNGGFSQDNRSRNMSIPSQITSSHCCNDLFVFTDVLREWCHRVERCGAWMVSSYWPMWCVNDVFVLTDVLREWCLRVDRCVAWMVSSCCRCGAWMMSSCWPMCCVNGIFVLTDVSHEYFFLFPLRRCGLFMGCESIYGNISSPWLVFPVVVLLLKSTYLKLIDKST